MNKIYKVVWSKVKNCYVVVSEIAKNVITGGVKSAKVGKAPLANGMALGALMTFVITGSAWAADVSINSSVTSFAPQNNDTTLSMGGDLSSLSKASNPIWVKNANVIGWDNVIYNGSNFDGDSGYFETVFYAGSGNNLTLSEIGKIETNIDASQNDYSLFFSTQGGTIDVNADTINVTGVGQAVRANVDGQKQEHESKITITANDITLSGKIGVYAWDKTYGNAAKSSVVITASNNLNIIGTRYGVGSCADGSVDLNAKNIYIKGDEYAIGAWGGDVKIGTNKDFETAKIDGVIEVSDGSVVDVNLGSNGSINGKTVFDFENGGGVINIGLGTDSTWNVTGDSTVTNLGGSNGQLTGTGVTATITDAFEIADLNVTGVDLEIQKGLTTTTQIKSDSNVDVPFINANGNNILVEAGTLNVNNSVDTGAAYAIKAADSSNVSGMGNVNITATGNYSYGVDALNGSTVELGGADKVVSITATGKGVESEANAVFASGSKIDITAGTLTIGATSENANQPGSSLQAKDGGVVNVVADNATINGMIYAGGVGSVVDIECNVNADINGDIYVDNGGGVSIDLADKESSFTGAVTTDGTGGVVLDLKDGATWYVTEDSTVGSIVGDDFNIVAADKDKVVEVTIECGKHNFDIVDDYANTNVNLENVNMNLIASEEDGLTDGVTINSINGDITVVSGTEHGITINKGGKVGVIAENVTIDSFKAAIWMDKNGDEVNKGEASIVANGDIKLTSKDRFAINNESKNYGVIDVSGRDVTIISENMPAIKVGERVVSEGYNGIVNVTGENITLKGSSHEIIEGWEQRASVVYTEGGTINLSATDALTITDTANIGGNAVGAYSGGSVNIKNAASVAINGSVYATGEGSEVDFSGAENVTVNGDVTLSDKAALVLGDATVNGIVNINDSTWNVTGDSTVTNLGGSNGQLTGTGVTATITDAFEIVNLDVTGVGLEIQKGLTCDTSINSSSDVKLNTEGNGVQAYGNEVNIKATDVVLDTGKSGIEATNGGKVDVTATNVTFNTGGNYEDSVKGGAIHITNETEDRSVVSIKASEEVNLTSKDRYAINNRSRSGGLVEVFGKNVTLISENRTAVKAGGHVGNEGLNGIVTVGNENTETITIKGHAQNIYKNTEPNEHKSSVVYAQGGTVNLNAIDDIEITDTRKNGGKTVAVYDGGNVNIKDAANLTIDGEVYATGEGSRINIVDVKDVKVTSTQGSAINNASNNSVVEIGSEKTETVTITGATEDLREVFDKNANLVNYNEDNRAVVFTRGNINITATEKVEITDTNEGKAIDAHGGANVIIDGGEATVINGEVYADGHEYALQDDDDIEHQDSGKGENINVTILGKDITIDAKGGEGVFARGDSVGGDNAVITVGDANTENVSIANTTIGLFAWYDGSRVEVNGDKLEINSAGTEEDAGVGIYAGNNGAVYDKPATVDVNSAQTKITVNDGGSECTGIWADSYGVVNVNGSLEVNAKSGVMATDGGNVNVKNAIDAKINGEVYAAGKDSKVNFTNVENVNITETKEHGISVNNGGKVDVVAENVTIDSYKAAVWLDDLGDNAVTIKANGNVNLTSEDRFAVNNESVEGSLIDVSGKNVVVTSKKRTAVKAGGMLGKEGKNGTVNISGETVTIQGSAQNTVVENEPNEHNASVVYAQGKGVVNLSATDALVIIDTAKVGGNAVSAYEGGTINVKDTDNLVVDGAVYANGEGSRVNIEANKGSISGNVEAEDNASVVVTLKSKEASFTGATKVTNAEKGVTLNLQQGATWNVTGDSTVSSVIGDNFNITKATDVNEEVTVTIDGRHADGITDDYASTTSTITGVDLVLHEDNGLNGNQTIISDSDVTLHSKGNGIAVDNGNYVTIEAAEFTLNQGTGFDAIRVENGGAVNIGTANAVLDGSVYATGEGSKVDFTGTENVTVDATDSVVMVSDGATVKTGNITLTGNGEEGKVEAIGLNKGNFTATGAVTVTASGYSAYGIEALAGSTVELGASDKDVILTITSNGIDNAEAQAITAEGGSKVNVNANKLGIITIANSKVSGSLQARDKDSEITVKATDVNVKGDIFTGEGAKVAINTTTFATEGIIGSEGVIDITTGDVAYGAGTQFYTEDAGVINLAGGNVTGEINVVKGNVNLIAGNVTSKLNIAKDSTVTLTGATFATDNLATAIVGNGKLVVDDKGILETTADQVFTVGGKDTITADVKILADNAINDHAKEKVTFKSGSLSLSDDYSYDYLTSITDVMKKDNDNATKLVMTGNLVNASSINPDDIETDEKNQLDVNDASNLGSDVHLDNVTVKTDNNLLIGGSASEDAPVEVDGVKATDSVANGFSADGLDLGGADGAIITGGKEVTLGGSNGNDKIVSSTVESTTLVVGTGSDDSKGKGTLNIGTNNDADYKHHGKVHVNHGSDLNTKGNTQITDGVELEGGNLNVHKDGHLEADIIVESKGKSNNGNNGNDKDKDKVTITGKVTGNLKVNNNKEEGHPSTMIHLGNEKIAGKLHAETADLNGATLFLDPEEAYSISDASMFTLKYAGSLNGNIVVGQNSVAAFGVSSAAEVEKAFAKTGFSFGNDGQVNSVVYVADAIEVDSGSIIADGSRTTANPGAPAESGTIKFASGSVLMVDAEDVVVGAVIKEVKSVEIAASAKLYIDDVKIDDAKKVGGTSYTIFAEATGKSINASWAAENISTNNQLIKFTDASIVDGKLELKTDGVQKVNDVYEGEVVAGEVVDKAIGTNASSSDFFNSAVDKKVNTNTVAQADALNSSLAINEVAGVTHTTYAVSNILTDAVADHMSLANGKEHDKDIWAHYVHTKEDVDGLRYGEYNSKYGAQYNGIVVGSDLYKEGKATVGAALTYVDGNINGSSVAARTENDAKYYGASIYGSIQNNDTAVIADVSYLHGEHDITQRNSGKVITGEPESDAFSVGVRVEKEAKAGIGKLVPYAGLRYMHLGTGNYTNSIGLAYDADDTELFLLPVGLKYSADIKNTNGWTMRPVVEFGYVWVFGDTDADQTVSLNGASNGFGYDVTDSGSYVGRFMLEAEKANLSYALGYEYQKGDDVKADKWMVNVNWKF